MSNISSSGRKRKRTTFADLGASDAESEKIERLVDYLNEAKAIVKKLQVENARSMGNEWRGMRKEIELMQTDINHLKRGYYAQDLKKGYMQKGRYYYKKVTKKQAIIKKKK